MNGAINIFARLLVGGTPGVVNGDVIDSTNAITQYANAGSVWAPFSFTLCSIGAIRPSPMKLTCWRSAFPGTVDGGTTLVSRQLSVIEFG
jgi:hypothetical protein